MICKGGWVGVFSEENFTFLLGRLKGGEKGLSLTLGTSHGLEVYSKDLSRLRFSRLRGSLSLTLGTLHGPKYLS